MSTDPIETPDNDSESLSGEWKDAAHIAVHNLGFDDTLKTLSPEHWQMVLTSVETRMNMRGISPPFG